MAKRKERSLEELYKLTVKMAKPRVTPILEGNFQIQGPVDESDSEFEVEVVDNTGCKNTVTSLAEHLNNPRGTNMGIDCDNHIQNSIAEYGDSIASNGKTTGKESSDKCNIRKQVTKDFSEREETLTIVKKRAHDNVQRARRSKSKGLDLASSSSECDQEIEERESIHMIEENKKNVECIDASKTYCKSELHLCRDQMLENHEKHSSSQGAHGISQGAVLSCESVQSSIPHKRFNILGSQGTPQNDDLDVQVCSDNYDLKEQNDLDNGAHSINGNCGNEIADSRSSVAFDAVEMLSEKNAVMFSKVLTNALEKGNQTEVGSKDGPREGVYASPDLLPHSDVDNHMHSSSGEHTEKISEMYISDDSCNAKGKEKDIVMDDCSQIEKADTVTDGLTKLVGGLADTSYTCLEETHGITEKVITSGTESSVNVIDECKPASNQGVQDHTILTTTSSNSNAETIEAYANPCPREKFSITCSEFVELPRSGTLEVPTTSSHHQKEPQNRYNDEGAISEEIICSSSLVTPDHFAASPFTMHPVSGTKEIEAHSSGQLGEDIVSSCSTYPIEFPSSKKSVQENTAVVTVSPRAVQSPEDHKAEFVKNNSSSGFLATTRSLPSSGSRKDLNQVPVEPTLGIQAAFEQSTRATLSQMDPNKDSGKDNTEVGLSEMERASLVSEPLFEDKSEGPVLVEDDVKVCDICGDTGREEMLAICSMCNDGAEHIYCMQTMLDKVPEGNWLCEGCQPKQNSSLKRIETAQNFSQISKPASLSSKKQSTNCSSHSRLSAKLDRKKFEPEIKRPMKGIYSSQTSTKRRAEGLEVGSATKKRAVEVKSVQQVIASTNAKPVISRSSSFKALDTGRVKLSLAVSSTGNQMISSLHNSGKSSNAVGAQSPRSHVGPQSSKSRFTSVNCLTSDSLPIIGTSSNTSPSALSTLTVKVPQCSKSADACYSPNPPSRSSNIIKSTADLKFREDFGEVGEQATFVREGTGSSTTNGGSIKAINNSLSFKSKGNTKFSTLTERRTSADFQNDGFFQIKQMRVGKQRKEGTDLPTKQPLVKSENTPTGSVSMGVINPPLLGKPASKNTCAGQTTLRVELSRKDSCKLKPIKSEEKPIGSPSSMAPSTIKEECTPTMLSGEPLLQLIASSSMSETGSMDVKSQLFSSSEALCNTTTQTSNEQCLLEMTSGIKSMPVVDISSFPADTKKCGSPKNKLGAEAFFHSGEGSNSDNKPKEFASFTWSSQNFFPAAGSTRCYKCKEFGHSAQFCSNRSSADAGNGSLRVSALIASAARSSRDISGSSSGKWKNPIESAVLGNKKNYEDDRTSDQRDLPLQFEEQVQEGRSENNLPGQVSVNIKHKFAVSSQDTIGVCGRPDLKIFANHEFTSSASDLCRNVSTAIRVPVSGHCKESLGNHSSTNTNPIGDVTSPRVFLQKNAKWSTDGQTYSSQKILADTEGSLRRNISCSLPVFQPPTQIDTVKMAALPEHNFLWQGGFEAWSKENPVSYYDGIQAHASTCADPKVLDAAKKFPSRVQLEEVPRWSTWPVQFQCSRPSEENIALYFFARDIESYERPYRRLLEHMLKNDLALRGNFGGVELLIFPSNQLPEKSQRWNRLLFLWGVFRERKANCMESSAYPQERTNVQLSTTGNLTAGHSSVKVLPRVLPSLPMAAFSEMEEMDIDVEGDQEVCLTERGFSGLGRAKSDISLLSPSFSSQGEGKTKVLNVHNASYFAEQKLASTQKIDNLAVEDAPSFKKHSLKSSFESGHGSYSKAANLTRVDDPNSSPGCFTSSIQNHHVTRENSICQKEIHRPLEAEVGMAIELQISGQSTSSQISSWRERINSTILGHASSGPSTVSSSSLERQDNSSDSSKIAQVGSHSPARQLSIEKEKVKSRDYEYNRGREKAKEMEYVSLRHKDFGRDMDWKPREREKERERERDATTERERERRILTKRREEYSSRESRHGRDSRHERRHRYSHSPPRRGSQLHSPSIRMNNYDRHHSRTHSPDFNLVRHSQPLSAAEVCGSHQKDIVSLQGNPFNDVLADGKGQRKLKKSYSEIYVRESCREQDSSGRSSSVSSHGRPIAGLDASTHISGSSASGHIQQEDQEYNVFFPKDLQMTERFFFPGSLDAKRNCNKAKAPDQWPINQSSKQSSSEPSSTVQFISSVEDGDQEPPDLNVPNLELALGEKKTSPKQGALPLFVQLLDKTSTQQQPTSPTTSSLIQGSEDGSSLSLSLAFPLSQKEQSVKSMMKEDQILPNNGNVNTSLLLFGGAVDS
eukprot:Gb_18601 [translate_table: standard]